MNKNSPYWIIYRAVCNTICSMKTTNTIFYNDSNYLSGHGIFTYNLIILSFNPILIFQTFYFYYPIEYNLTINILVIRHI